MKNCLLFQFIQTNNLELIARAHQLVMEGYKLMFQDTIVTVWSAPNYCYRCGNVAAILEFDEHLNKRYKIFEAAPQDARGLPSKKPAPDCMFLKSNSFRLFIIINVFINFHFCKAKFRMVSHSGFFDFILERFSIESCMCILEAKKIHSFFNQYQILPILFCL